MKRCTRCGAAKPAERFSRDRRARDGLKYWCKPCANTSAAHWSARHPELEAAGSRRYRAKNHEKSLRENRASGKKTYAKHRESVLAKQRAAYAADPLPAFLRAHKRRVILFAAPGACSAEQIRARIAFYGGRCAYCRGPYEHLDHVVPISRGGSNWAANIRPACSRCNLSKGAKPLSQWLPERPRALAL